MIHPQEMQGKSKKAKHKNSYLPKAVEGKSWSLAADQDMKDARPDTAHRRMVVILWDKHPVITAVQNIHVPLHPATQSQQQH